jgi:hypothetical protein
MYKLLILFFFIATHIHAALPETFNDPGTREAVDYLDIKVSKVASRIDTITGVATGPQGPSGSQGPIGTTGATGPAGPQGSPGIADDLGNHIATMTLTANYGLTSSTITASGTITGTYIYGDGSNLTGITRSFGGGLFEIVDENMTPIIFTTSYDSSWEYSTGGDIEPRI